MWNTAATVTGQLVSLKNKKMKGETTVKSKYENIYVIGEINGDYEKFQDVWQQLAVQPQQDLVVFLGNYIGTGDGNGEMMSWLLEHQKDDNLVFIEGVNESFMYTAEVVADETEENFAEIKSVWREELGGFEVECAMDEQADVGKFYEDWYEFMRRIHRNRKYEMQDESGKLIFVHQNLRNRYNEPNATVFDTDFLKDSDIVKKSAHPRRQLVAYEIRKKKFYIPKTDS
ncbi:hypothetical protein SELR_pSRC102400 (plasmid) [Selenomonas ruminantium subsp. lactilytica TAM6421]|uniref:Calcineurin-like phosphoesterase domain-containing protein n=1 Tax=Selenomonas ruminantium subsp. lactilytica (strain NBRC 103574 / TAM6421) TaxID=927704 RepID=I0GWB0_SELRL|nr:metallophosphoesterase [Selenomonas ruminantium]BAL85047.1 hypothetical protein SELR_pSRC102400 [Selenomonas ruminantium subsp. lactilytica TAM6421]